MKLPLRARLVLDDCKVVLVRLDSVTDEQSFRIYWAALVALLRAVGHVLDKVDAKNDTRTRAEVDRTWNGLKANRDANPIFFDFIESERNSVLKTYEAGYHPGDVDVLVSTGSKGESFTLNECLFKPLINGPFAGEDARDVAKEAIQWWESQLSAIEATANIPT